MGKSTSSVAFRFWVVSAGDCSSLIQFSIIPLQAKRAAKAAMAEHGLSKAGKFRQEIAVKLDKHGNLNEKRVNPAHLEVRTIILLSSLGVKFLKYLGSSLFSSITKSEYDSLFLVRYSNHILNGLRCPP